MAEGWTSCIGFLASTFGCQKETNHSTSSQEILHVTFSDEELPERSQQSEKHPLFAAIANKNLSDLQHILTTTRDAKELRDEDGYTALHRVISVADEWEQSPDAVKCLLEKGFDPNIPTGDNHSLRAPLQLVLSNESFSSRSYAILQQLLEQDGILVDSCDKFQNSALKLAAEKGHLGAVEMLISKSADVNRSDNCRNTALYCAAKKNHQEVASLLLANRADSTHQNKDFETALHIAVVSKHPAMVALLLSYGNREALTKENKNDETPLQVAKMLEPDPDVKKIIEMLSNPESVTPFLVKKESAVEADCGGAQSLVRPRRFGCFVAIPQGTDQPRTVNNITYHTEVHGGLVAVGTNSTVNVNSPLPAGFPDLPEDDNNSTERVLSVECSAPDGSANSSDQMDNSLSQHQKGNEGTTTTYRVEIKDSSGNTAVGDNPVIAVSPTQEELPCAFGRTVPNVHQGTTGDQRGDSASKPGVPKLARVTLKK